MFSQNEAFLEKFWGEMLSRDTQSIRAAFNPLNTQDRKTVIEHLNRMVTEDGWHAEQRASAQAALDVIKDLHTQI